MLVSVKSVAFSLFILYGWQVKYYIYEGKELFAFLEER